MNAKHLLDLFCGAGGCTRGYQLAGFQVTGVDHAPQPRYCGDNFVQADALEYLAAHGREYDAIHASPPCQGYSVLRHLPWLKDRTYPMLIDPTRDALRATGRPWVIENVERAPLDGIMLCGLHFDLRVYRHRLFESSVLLLAPSVHPRHPEVLFPGRAKSRDGVLRPKVGLNYRAAGACLSIAGHSSGATVAKMSVAMGINWMRRCDLTQAIPPAYTEYIGRQLRRFC